MGKEIENRIIEEAKFFLDNDKATVRDVADEFNVSKSTVHLDLTNKLKEISGILHQRVKEKLEHNKKVRHIRGGQSTKEYWENKKAEKAN